MALHLLSHALGVLAEHVIECSITLHFEFGLVVQLVFKLDVGNVVIILAFLLHLLDVVLILDE